MTRRAQVLVVPLVLAACRFDPPRPRSEAGTSDVSPPEGASETVPREAGPTDAAATGESRLADPDLRVPATRAPRPPTPPRANHGRRPTRRPHRPTPRET
jgi:hypothetical protein